MKTIRLQAYGGPEQLKLEDAPEPKPDAGQILVRIHAASVNPWDTKLASGRFSKDIPMKLPYIPGGDFSGVVESVGAGVTTVKPGDAVYGNAPHGAYAELLAVSAATIAPKPAKLSHEQAAGVPVAAQTAWQGLFEEGNLQPGQTVLIHAAGGGVGSFAVQVAHWKGARVSATASADGIDYVRSLGADEAIDYKATPFESVVKSVDLVLDLVGGQTQERSFGVIKPGGALISTVNPPSQELAAKANVRAKMFSMKATSARLTQLAELLDAGTLKPAPITTLPLAQAADAWKQILSGHTRGKIVLKIQG
jgi:NADPH:quinone reductase-like Zn-dependent oxidoreductase